MIKRILLDIDGVIGCFVKAAANLFNEDYDELLKRWPLGEFNMEVVLGISKTQFFKKIDDAGEDFWANIPPYPYIYDVFNHCKSIAPTYILSAPTYHHSSLSGKLRWMNSIFGSGFRDYALSCNKELCANPNHVLIDDLPKNINTFREHGGYAILWPTPFNERHEESKDPFKVVKGELDSLVALFKKESK